MTKIEKEVLICDCFSTEHQLTMTYLSSDSNLNVDELSIEIRLVSYRNFWGRLVAGVKYIFGHKSKYGDWDDFIINEQSCDKMIGALQNLKKSYNTVNKGVNGVK